MKALNYLLILVGLAFSCIVYASQILSEVEDIVSSTKNPVVIFDLDDTLFYSSSRTLTILHEASRDPYIIEKYPNQIEWLNKIKFDDIGYLFKDTLVEIGVRDASFFGRDVTLLA